MPILLLMIYTYIASHGESDLPTGQKLLCKCSHQRAILRGITRSKATGWRGASSRQSNRRGFTH